jgi:FAD/FMN-containing dehydrogenase
MRTKLARQTERALVTALRSSLRGAVIDREHPGYDAARRVWNGLIDRHPAVMARCADTADVVETVRVAREHRPLVSVRGGGHQVAGSAVCDNGLVIDLSRMKDVRVDPVARTVRAQGGVTWGELDRATQTFALATTGGEVSTTGIAGFTLGGGMGILMRRHGLACDNLRSIEVVTADGEVLTASQTQYPDLFWAARGGGRGLGVVTSFEFDLHALGPEVAAAQVLYRYDDARRILRAFRDVAPRMPETVAPELALWTVLPDPSIPERLHGSKVVLVAGVYAGPAAEGDAVLTPLRQLATPLADLSGPVPYLTVQSALDDVFEGGRFYMKSHFMDELGDAAIDTLLRCDARRPTPETLTVIRTLGGAIARVGPDDTAYSHRSAVFNLSIDAAWFDPALDREAIGWSRDTWDGLRPFATGGVYLNFSGLGEEAASLRDAVQGRTRERLTRVRWAYDPEGLFEAAAGGP